VISCGLSGGAEIAGVDIAAQSSKGGHRGSGHCGSDWGWLKALMKPITMKRNAMFFGHVNSRNVN